MSAPSGNPIKPIMMKSFCPKKRSDILTFSPFFDWMDDQQVGLDAFRFFFKQVVQHSTTFGGRKLLNGWLLKDIVGVQNAYIRTSPLKENGERYCLCPKRVHHR